MKYKKQLPKLERGGQTYFVTFATWERLELTPDARKLVLDTCLFFHGQRYHLFAVVIMPDHVHLLIQPFANSETEYWSIGSILHSIKGYSAKQIPKVMKHIGKLWQDGRHDIMMKNREHFVNTWQYIRQNPVEAGLSITPETYQFLWEDCSGSASVPLAGDVSIVQEARASRSLVVSLEGVISDEQIPPLNSKD